MGSQFLPDWLLKTLAVVVGAIFGSFANVLIYRLPLGISIVTPRSFCPICHSKIAWYDNIPILSFLVLLGRCRKCKNPISLRYPITELCASVLSLACLYLATMRGGGIVGDVGILVNWFFPFMFVFLLLVVTFIDFEYFRIPHVLTILGIANGCLSSLFISDFTGITWIDCLIGIVAGAFPTILIIEGYFRLTKREGMGYGDVMLFAMVGANLGYESIIFVYFASSMQGIIFSLPLIWRKIKQGYRGGESVRHMPIPFGPFISVAAMEWLYFEGLIREMWRKIL